MIRNKYIQLLILGIVMMGTPLLAHSQILTNSQNPLRTQDMSVTVNNNLDQKKILDQRVSINYKEANIKKVLQELEEKAGLKLVYHKELLIGFPKVTLESESISIKELLDTLFKGTQVGYWAARKYVIVHKSSEKNPQLQTIQGVVYDAESDQTLPGVNVVVKGTTIGTSTESDGQYELNVPSLQDTLVFSFVGYQTREIPIQGRTNINVNLKPQVVSGEELVVVGYGTQQRRNLSASVTSVDSREIEDMSSTSVTDALQGKVAGMSVITGSHAPGGSMEVRIRGINSVQSNSSPLYVIDGFPATSEDVRDLSSTSISSVDILKDASATAIYGSRGSNGVILITTKEGSREGPPQIEYKNYVRIEEAYNNIELLNGEQFANAYNEFMVNIGDQPYYDGSEWFRPNPEDVGKGTNWFDKVTQTGVAQNHSLTVSGGADNYTYSLTGSFLNHKGVVINTDFTRGTLQLNTDVNVTDWLTIGNKLQLKNTKTNGPGGGAAGNASIVNSAIMMSPVLPVKNPNGDYSIPNFPSMKQEINPVANAKEVTRESTGLTAMDNISATLNFMENLSLKIKMGGRFNNGESNQYTPMSTFIGSSLGGIAQINADKHFHFINENTLRYKKNFSGHNFNILGGYTREYEVNEGHSISGSGFPSDGFGTNNLNAANEPGAPSSWKNKWQLASYLGRVNYNYRGKYMLSLTGRADGSSKFGDNHKWSFFPSASLGWMLSEESFMDDMQSINRFKLRISYGQTGNSRIGNYVPLAQLQVDNYVLGGQSSLMQGVAPQSLENPDLKWETTTTYNAGMDIGFFEDRLNLSADAYYKLTTDLLLWRNVPQTSGFGGSWDNMGELENKGLEFSVEAIPVRSQDFEWNINTNFSRNINKILELNGDESQVWRIGNPVNVFRLYKTLGVFNTQEEINNYTHNGEMVQPNAEPGDVKYADVASSDGTNGPDGKITGEDQMILGSPQPKFSFGITNTLTYKRFYMSFFLTGMYDRELQNHLFSAHGSNAKIREFNKVASNLDLRYYNNRWTPENAGNATAPKLGGGREMGRNIQPQDASYIELKNVKLQYNLPDDLINGVQIRDFSIYVSGQNLFTLTDYYGFSPDVSNDWGSYPPPRVYTIGLNIGL